MRILRVVITLATLIPATGTLGQDQWGVSPVTWLGSPPPTVRSWGMGFTGVASWHPDGAPVNPAALGIWAQSPRVVFGHNYEQTPPNPATSTDYDISSSSVASGAHWSMGARHGDVRLGVGVLYRETNYRWGPAMRVSQFEEGALLIENGRTREWAVGVALRYGVEVGLGIDHKETSTSWTNAEDPPRVDWISYYGGREHSRIDIGVVARLPVFRTLALMGIGDTIMNLGPVNLELSGTMGKYPLKDDFRSGVSLRADVQYKTLPLLIVEGTRDSEDDIFLRGFEVSIGGFYSYRAGDWNYRTYRGGLDGSPVIRPWVRWPTRGYALHSAGLVRWFAHWVQTPLGRALERVASHVDLFYETAWFPDSGNRPPGFGEVRGVEWGISLTNLDRLW